MFHAAALADIPIEGTKSDDDHDQDKVRLPWTADHLLDGALFDLAHHQLAAQGLRMR